MDTADMEEDTDMSAGVMEAMEGTGTVTVMDTATDTVTATDIQVVTSLLAVMVGMVDMDTDEEDTDIADVLPLKLVRVDS